MCIDHHHPDGAHPDQHRQRLWNMTTAELPASFCRPAGAGRRGGSIRSGVTRIGKETSTPRLTDRSETRNATWGHESLEVDLSYPSSIFEEFLHAMSVIQFECGRRPGRTAPSAPAVRECLGGSSRV